jgi:hypothetical protein
MRMEMKAKTNMKTNMKTREVNVKCDLRVGSLEHIPKRL